MSSRAILALCLLFLGALAWGDDKKLACDPDTNICAINISEDYCAVGEVAKSKWDIRSGTYILSCECDCTAQENRFWLVGADGGTKLLDASKVISSVDIEKNELGIPDAFGIVPYCEPIEVQVESLIYLSKRPSGRSGMGSYCYSLVEKGSAESCSTDGCLEKQRIVERTADDSSRERLSEFREATSRIYKDAQRVGDYPRRDFVESYLRKYGYSTDRQQDFNDIAYFWQQAGFSDEAIWLLVKVLEDNPKRIVTYLNIADAYWAQGEKAKAAESYRAYISLVNANDKQQKVPQRAHERSASSY